MRFQKSIYEKGVEYKVYKKNTLIAKALENLGC